ncbi:MAG: DUF488 domain-containing protein [Coriobacteriia bacterium]|nr:DUF488 domain-containing protein [Coriobacteriia bacterium]
MGLPVHTVGHSTRSADEFVALLREFGIGRVADVRTVPRSRHNPQFDISVMPDWLSDAGIAYEHMPGLGGFRHAAPDSRNLGWHSLAFRGYADYMQSPEFATALDHLVVEARQSIVAVMCAEAVPWRCHRSLIGDVLVVRGIPVNDIIGPHSSRPHRLTAFAEVDGERLTYPLVLEPAKRT